MRSHWLLAAVVGVVDLDRPDGQAASTERRQAPLDSSSWALQVSFSVEKLGYLLDRLHPQPGGARTRGVLVA